jgi:hypothetical protein
MTRRWLLPPAPTARDTAAAAAEVGEHPADDRPEISAADGVDEDVDRRIQRDQNVIDAARLNEQNVSEQTCRVATKSFGSTVYT